MKKIVYICDPKKNKICRKTACGEFCNSTFEKKYAKRVMGIPIIDRIGTRLANTGGKEGRT